MRAVFEHEIDMYFHSMRVYVFTAFLLCFTGIGALIYNINASIANFEYVLAFISIVFIVLIPLMTMQVMAEERKQKTDQLLFALPISTTEIIVGKFLALAAVFAIPVVVICFYPVMFSSYGEVYLPASYGAIFAFYLLGLSLFSIGMFISCQTDSPAMAAGICFAVMLFIYYGDTLADYVSSTAVGSMIGLFVAIVLISVLVRLLTKSAFAAAISGLLLCIAVISVYLLQPEWLDNLLPNLMNAISLFTRFETFVGGLFDLNVVVYDLSVIAFFQYLCVQALEKRRYNG